MMKCDRRSGDVRRFRKLCKHIGTIMPGEVDDTEGTKEVLTWIQTLIAFVEAN